MPPPTPDQSKESTSPVKPKKRRASWLEELIDLYQEEEEGVYRREMNICKRFAEDVSRSVDSCYAVALKILLQVKESDIFADRPLFHPIDESKKEEDRISLKGVLTICKKVDRSFRAKYEQYETEMIRWFPSHEVFEKLNPHTAVTEEEDRAISDRYFQLKESRKKNIEEHYEKAKASLYLFARAKIQCIDMLTSYLGEIGDHLVAEYKQRFGETSKDELSKIRAKWKALRRALQKKGKKLAALLYSIRNWIIKDVDEESNPLYDRVERNLAGEEAKIAPRLKELCDQMKELEETIVAPIIKRIQQEESLSRSESATESSEKVLERALDGSPVLDTDSDTSLRSGSRHSRELSTDSSDGIVANSESESESEKGTTEKKRKVFQEGVPSTISMTVILKEGEETSEPQKKQQKKKEGKSPIRKGGALFAPAFGDSLLSDEERKEIQDNEEGTSRQSSYSPPPLVSVLG